MGEENPPGLAEPEQAGGLRTGKKPTNPLVQQTVFSQPQIKQDSIPKAQNQAAEEARIRQPTGKSVATSHNNNHPCKPSFVIKSDKRHY